MKIKLTGLMFAAACAVVISGCDSGGIAVMEPGASNNRPSSSNQSVFGELIAPQQVSPENSAALSPNLLPDPGFETDQWGWTGCSTDSISASSDASEGSAALAIRGGSCTFRSVQVNAGDSYTFSCYAKLAAPAAWTGLGMTYATETYQELLVAPTAVITSTDYMQIQTTAVAPEGSALLSLWVYSDPGVLIDNCRLSLTENVVPPEEPIQLNNLLQNGDFSQTDDQNNADNWVLGCGGSSIADGTGLYVADKGCVDQAFSASAVQAINDAQQVTFSCFVVDVSDYSDMSVFLGENQLAGEREITAADKNTRVSLTVESINTANAFVSVYSEGYLSINDCTFTLEGEANPAPDAQPNLVETATQNGRFTSLVSALQATGLDAVLADETRVFTIFAPTDEAFAALGEETLTALFADTERLSDILLYHVLADSDVNSTTAISLAGNSVAAANGDDLNLTVNDASLFINESQVVTPDVTASNGTIHVINAVLLPPEEETAPAE